MKPNLTAVCILIILSLWLAGCSAAAPTPLTPAPVQTATGAAAVIPTATPEPSATPAASKVILVAAPAADPAVQAALTDLTGSAGLTLETRPALAKTDLTADMKVIVLLAPQADLGDLLAAAPQAQFIVVSGADLPAVSNLTVIRYKAEDQAFVAGFVGVLLSTDYRAAGLLPGDGPLGPGLKEAFVNGGHYFCGVCAPGWPLIYFPLVAEQPSAADGPTWQASAAGLYETEKVEVFYLSAAAARPEVLNYLQGQTQAGLPVVMFGEQAPPDGLQPQWAASINFDIPAALRQLWPDIAAGKGGAVHAAPVGVTHVNPDLLGEGRMRLVREVLAGLSDGSISPMSVPAQ